MGIGVRQHARAVVIGGGVVGVSTLYHLCKKGWTDSVLIERKELTSGSTWHAAGLLPLFNLGYGRTIHKYSLAFSKALEKERGLNVGLRKCQTSASPAPATGWTNITITPASRRRSASR